MRERLREINQLPSNGTIQSLPYAYGTGGLDLRSNYTRTNTEASQSILYDSSETLRQCLHVSGGRNYRKKRLRTHQQQKRLTINNDAIDVPIAKRGVRDIGIARRLPQRLQHLLSCPQHHHACLPA